MASEVDYPVADPGFPRGGAANPRGGGGRQDMILLKFPENCTKSKKIRPGGGGEGARVPCAPLDLPLPVPYPSNFCILYSKRGFSIMEQPDPMRLKSCGEVISDSLENYPL